MYLQQVYVKAQRGPGRIIPSLEILGLTTNNHKVTKTGYFLASCQSYMAPTPLVSLSKQIILPQAW